ncbi:hypothetical protein LTR36_009063 [Oleoguttula mirabilis]|uniref:HMG box domain-containing protein n=1 Tax=Oleoguttula mirabilis TaxID=1507867 RepID=A0AAV9J6J4_9PEZI|nr:hypothetical protein LTR36_009063 [Oleoguttula mirabilis]
MAAQFAALNPKLPPTHAGQLLRDFIDAFDSVQEQLKKGTTPAVVPLTKISLLGTEGVAILKKHLEDATNARFTFSVNASANSVTLIPTGPMPPKPAVTAQTLASPAGVASKASGSKVPRPPNAFIIYRKEWHSRTVAQNPGLHNNAISVILGQKWKAEADHVRAEYKRRAEDAKTQHATNNPGYQYQPRKPSEKKKRMTKNKLAKLAAKAEENGNIIGELAQQPLPDDFDPVSMLDEHLGACAEAQAFTVNAYGQVPVQRAPVLHTNHPWNGFHSGPDPNDTFCSTLEAWNRAHPLLDSVTGDAAFTAQPMINGIGVTFENTNTYLPGVGFYEDAANAAAQSTQENVMSPTGGMDTPHDPYAEVHRQDRLTLDFGDLVDYDGCAGNSGPNSVDPAEADLTYDTDDQVQEADLNNFALSMVGDENAHLYD